MHEFDKEAIEPIIFYNQGICPMCNQGHLQYISTDRITIDLDKYGRPISADDEYIVPVIKCTNKQCDFIGVLGIDFIKLEDGSFKWVTGGEKIYEEERMKKIKPPTHLHADDNPFVEL